MDFQASDVIGALLGACTPGDIRVHYTAQFVDVASIMGAVHPTKDLVTTQTVSVKGGGSSKESYRLGVVHKGAFSAQDMMKKELAEGRCGQFSCVLAMCHPAAPSQSNAGSCDGFFGFSCSFGPPCSSPKFSAIWEFRSVLLLPRASWLAAGLTTGGCTCRRCCPWESCLSSLLFLL